MRRRPQIDHDIEEAPSYLESKGFITYCDRLLNIITLADKALSTGDQKKRLGATYNERRHQDALDSLTATGRLERVGILPTRYQPIERHPVRVYTPAEKRNYWVSRLYPHREGL